MSTAVQVLFVVCLASFAWARRYFFSRTAQTRKGRRGLGPLGTIFGLTDLGLLIYEGSGAIVAANAVALALLAASLGVFWCSVAAFRGTRPSIAHTPGAPVSLVMTGPYRLVRHPFYLAYILSWLGCFAATPSILTFAPILVMTYLYFRTAKEEELSILSSDLGPQYAEYRRRTGMFAPNPAKLID